MNLIFEKCSQLLVDEELISETQLIYSRDLWSLAMIDNESNDNEPSFCKIQNPIIDKNGFIQETGIRIHVKRYTNPILHQYALFHEIAHAITIGRVEKHSDLYIRKCGTLRFFYRTLENKLILAEKQGNE